MIFCRLSFFVVASVTALAVSQINNIDSSKKTKSSYIKHSEKNGSSFKQSEGEEEKEEEKITDNLSEEEVKRVRRKMKTHILMKELEKRKTVLERKLLELYGLKEQQAFIAQTHSHLEEKMTGIAMLSGTVNTLRDEIKNLREEKKQNIFAKSQLERAKKMIEELEKKMDVNASHMKQQFVMLEEQVSEFQCNKETYNNNAMIEKKLKAVKHVELEYVEMQGINKELELEKRELTVELVGAQARITSLSIMTQEKILEKIEEEMRILRHTNEDLSKEVEQLQRNRFNMVEELVYQRWLNACLRCETQKYQTPSRKTSCDLNIYASPKAEKEAKQLVLDLSFDRISSPTSSSNDSNDSSTSTESSSNSQRSINSKKSGFVHSIKRWGRRSKDDLSVASSPDKSCRRSLFTRNGLIRRHSTSMVPSNKPSLLSSKGDTTKMVQESIESPDILNFPRARRVSFCDSVENFIANAPKSVEEVTDGKEINTKKSEQGSNMDGSPNCEAKLIGSPWLSSFEAIERDSLNSELRRRIESEELHSRKSNDFAGENQVGTSIFHLVAAFFFFLFMLLVYVLLLNAGIY